MPSASQVRDCARSIVNRVSIYSHRRVRWTRRSGTESVGQSVVAFARAWTYNKHTNTHTHKHAYREGILYASIRRRNTRYTRSKTTLAGSRRVSVRQVFPSELSRVERQEQQTTSDRGKTLRSLVRGELNERFSVCLVLITSRERVRMSTNRSVVERGTYWQQ